MAWLEQKNDGPYHVAFRFAGERYKVSLGTTDIRQAKARQERLEENIGLVKNGRLTLPDDAEIGEFLLSDGKLDGKPVPKKKLRTLGQYEAAVKFSRFGKKLQSWPVPGGDVERP